MTTPARLQAAMQGQSAIAMKIYNVTPIAEAWTSHQITSALAHTTTTRIDPKTVLGCLNTLKDSGLVREPERGMFQRITTREPQENKSPERAATERKLLTLASTPCAASVADSQAVAVSAISPIDLLSTLTNRLRDTATGLLTIASDIENAALAIEEEQTKNDATVDRLRQLPALLKSLIGE